MIHLMGLDIQCLPLHRHRGLIYGLVLTEFLCVEALNSHYGQNLSQDLLLEYFENFCVKKKKKLEG